MSGDGTGSRRGRSGPVRLRVGRLLSEARRSGQITKAEDLEWQLALDLAHLTDVARVQENLRDYATASARLQLVLDRLTASSAPVGAPGDGDPGEAGNADLYGAGPTVGDSADS